MNGTAAAIADPRPTLARIITQRLALTSLVAIILQVCVVAAQYYWDQDQFTLDYIGREASLLARGVSAGQNGRLVFKLPEAATDYARSDGGYAYRIVDSQGVIASSGYDAAVDWSSPRTSTRLELWFRRLDDTPSFGFAGGQRFQIGDRDVWVEVATRGDPQRRHWRVLALELSKLVWLPMMPLIVMLLGVAMVSVTRSLGPLANAARQAEQATLLESGQRFDLTGMPREAASFAAAINRLLDRGGDLLRGQKMFIAKAAHELRTPLAIMTLELGKIVDPRARRLEGDVASMSEMVNRLLTLARLGTLQTHDFADFDLGNIVDEQIDHIRPWVEEKKHRIAADLGEPQLMTGDPTAVREAVRNLIENAVKHTPAGTSVLVRVGPNGSVTVEDSGKGFGKLNTTAIIEPFTKGNASSEGAGLGLAIVREAVDLHHGKMEIGRSELGGARVRVEFAPG